MKVIREPTGEWSWVFTCRGCNGELEASLDDLKKGQFGGGWNEYGTTEWYAECPFCSTDTICRENFRTIERLKAVADKLKGDA